MAIDLRAFKVKVTAWCIGALLIVNPVFIKVKRLWSSLRLKQVIPTILIVGTITYYLTKPDLMWEKPPYSRLLKRNLSQDLHFLPSTSTSYSQDVYQFLNNEDSEHEIPEQSLDMHNAFNEERRDTLVFLYIQKTGGAFFEKKLFKMKTKKGRTCKEPKKDKQWKCENSRKETWLYTHNIQVPAWVCGVHADWTRIHKCVPDYLDDRDGKPRDRNFLYVTMLRNPLHRYISEWSHVERGATWLTSEFYCSSNVAQCFAHTKSWKGVSLNHFMNCPYNQANNRQTWMLADVADLGCKKLKAMSLKQRDQLLIKSAKSNLRRMAFFGLVEYQTASQELMEHSLEVKFSEPWTQKESHRFQNTHDSLSQDLKDKLIHLNKLDIELYQYAKDIFFQRLKRIRRSNY